MVRKFLDEKRKVGEIGEEKDTRGYRHTRVQMHEGTDAQGYKCAREETREVRDAQGKRGAR